MTRIVGLFFFQQLTSEPQKVVWSLLRTSVEFLWCDCWLLTVGRCIEIERTSQVFMVAVLSKFGWPNDMFHFQLPSRFPKAAFGSRTVSFPRSSNSFRRNSRSMSQREEDQTAQQCFVGCIVGQQTYPYDSTNLYSFWSCFFWDVLFFLQLLIVRSPSLVVKVYSSFRFAAVFCCHLPE